MCRETIEPIGSAFSLHHAASVGEGLQGSGSSARWASLPGLRPPELHTVYQVVKGGTLCLAKTGNASIDLVNSGAP